MLKIRCPGWLPGKMDDPQLSADEKRSTPSNAPELGHEAPRDKTRKPGAPRRSLPESGWHNPRGIPVPAVGAWPRANLVALNHPSENKLSSVEVHGLETGRPALAISTLQLDRQKGHALAVSNDEAADESPHTEGRCATEAEQEQQFCRKRMRVQ